MKYIYLLVICFFVCGCTKEYWQYTDEDGQVYKSSNHDSVLSFIEDISAETQVNGVVLLIDKKGNICQETPVVHNVVQGQVKFYKNNKLYILATYTNGVHNGVHKVWHDNGVLASISSYSNDVHSWDWSSWYDNGNKKSESYWVDMKLKILRERAWDKKGNLIADGVSSNLSSINGTFIVSQIEGQPPKIAEVTNGVLVRKYYYQENAEKK